MNDLPPIHDEASDTPAWVPVLGVIMLFLFGATYLVREQLAPDETAGEAPVATAEGAHAPEGAGAEAREHAAHAAPEHPAGP